MTPVLRYLFPVILTVFLTCTNPPAALSFDEPMQSIKTGNITGVYYAAGSAVAKMHNRKLKEYNLRLLAEASEGSIANIQDVAEGTAPFGIAQANALYYAKKGESFWQGEPQDKLRSVLGLYMEDFTIVAAVDAGINSMADLKGKTVNIGELGSMDAIQAIRLFNGLGLDPENDLTITEKPTYEASELLQSGDIDAYFYTVGHPNLSIKEASSGERKIMIVAPERDIVDRLDKKAEYLGTNDIPVDYYADIANKAPIHTLSVKAILFSHADTDEQIVYNIVKEVFENLDLFKRQHPAFANLTPEILSTRLIVPLHPGAERFFKEVGLLR